MSCAVLIIIVSTTFKFVIHSTHDEFLLKNHKTLGFCETWKIPGMVEYTIVYSCCKFMNYGWIMWLPYYLYTKLKLSHKNVGIIVVLYEIGAIFGSFGGGWISDKINSRSLTVKYMLLLVTPIMVCLWFMDNTHKVEIGFCSFGLGLCVAGVCYLINACVSSDLAVFHHQTATIAGIMDGTGSLFAGFGVFFIGYLEQFSWLYAFIIMIAVDTIAIATLQVIEKNKSKRNLKGSHNVI